MKQDHFNLESIQALRARLHACPEAAFQERKTKEILIAFLRAHTQLELSDMGSWFYAKWSGGGNKIAFRADFDAVTGPDGKPGHFCGHDGHAAILCGLAGWISENKPAATIYLIFQPAEEIGEGAKLCRRLLKEEEIPEIYGLHNIPGFPAGSVLVREGTFACASTGLELTFQGDASHAAYPENGRNPAGAVSELILWIRDRLQQTHTGVLLCTVIGAEIGSSAYGVSAGQAVLRLTVRGEIMEEYEALLAEIESRAGGLAAGEQLQLGIRRIEPFPATVNGARGIARLTAAARAAGKEIVHLREPMRWSEDFGYYLEEAQGAFFGIGAGEDHPQLHTEHYSFPDRIMRDALDVFAELVK